MREKTFELVKTSIEELNEDLDYESLRTVADDTPLFGGPESIDSLSLVRLVTDIERVVEEQLGKQITLADERAMSMKSSPFRDVGSLVEFVMRRLSESDA